MADQQIPETGQVRDGDGLTQPAAAPAPAPAPSLTAPGSATTGAPTGALPAAAGTNPTDYSADKLLTMTGTTAGPTSYTPDDSALVSSNLTKLISGDSDYMTLARTKAAQYANSRGLLNSSIGGGAGEAAAIEAALPIAQGDSQVNAAAQAANANAKNSFALDANQFQRQGALAAMNAGYTKDSQAADQQFKGTQADLDRTLKTEQFDKDLAQRDKQLTTDQQLKQATLEQELTRTYMDARMQLETSPNLSSSAKANAVNAMSDWFYNQALPGVRAAYGDPNAWPDIPPMPGMPPPDTPPVVDPHTYDKTPPVVAPPPSAAPQPTTGNDDFLSAGG